MDVRKWSVKSGIEGATTQLRQKDLVGKILSSYGLGYVRLTSPMGWRGPKREMLNNMRGIKGNGRVEKNGESTRDENPGRMA